MGVNQQTSVPAFTNGQVLTAQQQTQINTGVPVFADSTARDAAFGGAGEKVLAEGQLAYLENSNIVQYFDGSVWVKFGPNLGGLSFISKTSFTTATSISLPNNTFTTTFANYRITIFLTALTADADFTIRMRAGGTDDTNLNYKFAFVGLQTSGTASNQNANNGTAFSLGGSDGPTSVSYNLSLDIITPQLAKDTAIIGGYIGHNPTASNLIARSGAGTFQNTTVFDSFSFISSVASSMTGVVNVYGYQES